MNARRAWITNVFAASALSACSKPNPNVVPPETLAPRLLHDEAEIAKYVADFPRSEYQVRLVFGQGKFYIEPNTTDTIKDFLRRGMRWESDIGVAIDQHLRKDTTVLDIGAHIGTHAIPTAARLGGYGRVYAFEPQRKLFRELVHNAKLNGVANLVPLRFAIGDEPGIIEMNPSVQGNEGGTSVGHGGDRAELRTIDSFGFHNVSLIVIDVEGFERHVLAGANQTILANRPVMIIEIGDGPENEETQKIVADLGYKVTKLSPDDYLATPISATN